MDCALWLNRRKVFRADEIHNNADIASLRGYFLGGSLCKWLRSHGGDSFADMLDELSPDDPDLNEKLTRIFCGSAATEIPSIKLDATSAGDPAPRAVCSSAHGLPCSRGIFFGTDNNGSFGGSFARGSFGSYFGNYFGSYRFGSFGSYKLGSFMNEWEWEWVLGSFRRSAGSFAGTSYRAGSFGFGSFGSFRYGSFGSFRFGSFVNGMLPFGVFPRDKYGSLVMFMDEYDRIMYETLKKCPLDRFGYGIHII